MKNLIPALMLVLSMNSANASLDEFLVSILTAALDDRAQVLNKAIIGLPPETLRFVVTSVEAGYSHDDIIIQCKMGIESWQVASLMETLTRYGADIEKMTRACLPAVEPDLIVNAVTSILSADEQARVQSNLQSVMPVLNELGLDSTTILINSLVSGELLAADDTDCVGDCLRPLAQDLIDDIAAAPFDFEVDIVQDDEPALSDS